MIVKPKSKTVLLVVVVVVMTKLCIMSTALIVEKVVVNRCGLLFMTMRLKCVRPSVLPNTELISLLCCLLQLPVLFKGLGKRVLKMYLEIFFDVIFYAVVRFHFYNTVYKLVCCALGILWFVVAITMLIFWIFYTSSDCSENVKMFDITSSSHSRLCLWVERLRRCCVKLQRLSCWVDCLCSLWIVRQSVKLHMSVYDHSALILDRTYSVLELKVTILGHLLYTSPL